MPLGGLVAAERHLGILRTMEQEASDTEAATDVATTPPKAPSVPFLYLRPMMFATSVVGKPPMPSMCMLSAGLQSTSSAMNVMGCPHVTAMAPAIPVVPSGLGGV